MPFMKPELPAIRWSMVNSAATLRAHHCPGWSMENVPCMWVRMPVAMLWVVVSCGPCEPCQGHVGHVLVGTLVDQVSEYFETLG